MPPEALGLVCMARALRAGDLSEVQPIFGILPLLVLASGAVVLHEVPTVAATAGILVLAMGVYTVGLRPGTSALEPLRALARSRASWYAVGACVCWSITTVLHKYGIAAVGPLGWATTLAVGSGLVLAAALPLVAWRRGSAGAPGRPAAWIVIVVLAGVAFALQQVGLQLALRAAQASYVVAVTATSTPLATALGVALLGERTAARFRILGAALVSVGAVMIALGA
jgi:uncharacterized membrane protein